MSDAFVWPQLKGRELDLSPADARREAEAAGRAAGFEQGLEEGRAAAKAECEALRAQLATAVDDLAAQLDALRVENLERLAGVAHALCTRVLGHELRTNPAVLEGLLAQALARLEADAGSAEVFVNPEDHGALAARLVGDLTLHADPAVPPCGLSVRLPTQAADFQPLALIDELFEDVRDDLAG